MSSAPASFLESRPCPVCDARDAEPVVTFPADHYDHERFETASWDGRQSVAMHIVRCRCGLVRTDPAFREDHLGLVYPQDLVDVGMSERQLDRLFSVAHQRKFAHMASHVGRFLQTGATVVDIGARYGAFAHIARELGGFDAWGLEYNPAAVAVGRKRFDRLWQGLISDLPARMEAAGLDAVDGFVLDDVLEHLPHPNRDLATLARSQRSGGFVFLRQMDMASLGRRRFGDQWYYLQPAAHMFYFDEASVTALLARHGYEVVDVQRPHPTSTAARTYASLPGQWLKRWRARRAPAGRRPSYLTQRFKGADDMFLVTARLR